MSSLIVRTFLFAIGLSLLICARPGACQEKITQENYHCDKYKGELAVFGTLTATELGVHLDLAQVKLTRSDGDSEVVFADKDGKYCIRYKSGADIATLSFADGKVTCVNQISGKSSHFINKVLDNGCAEFDASATALRTKTTKSAFTSAISNQFVVLQTNLSNTSGGILEIASYGFEREASTQGQTVKAADRITPVDPDMVALLVARQKSSVCLLCVGPVTLVQIPLHAHASDAEAYIRSHALRVNDIIPDGQSVMKLIFVDKSSMPKDTSQAGVLGTLVIRATKLTKSGESIRSTAVVDENSAATIAHPEPDSEGIVTALAKIK